jgi:predicted transcriptional regulator
MGRTTVYLSDDLMESLENKTSNSDIKKSQIVHRALRNYFEQDNQEDVLTIRQDQLESKVEDIEKVQNALLKNLNLKVKSKPEPEEVEEEEILLVGEEEDEEYEEEEEGFF